MPQADLGNTHFKARFKERTGFEMTPYVRRDLMNAVKTKEAVLLGSSMGQKDRCYKFVVWYNNIFFTFIVGSNGGFVTGFPSRQHEIAAYYRNRGAQTSEPSS